jgi:poly-gamma-glutamate synthesis protein (capsule biosynthesis protein)
MIRKSELIKIIIAGDFCPQNKVAKLIEDRDFNSVFGEVKNLLMDSDYSIVNFECPITYKDEKAIEKCGPNLKCSEQGLEALKWTGFNCVTLANNHFYDYGEEGVNNTLGACLNYGIDVVGGGSNLHEASKVLYKKINGQMLAIINCCEQEFSIATKKSGGSNPLNPIQLYYTIKDAKRNANYVLVIVHGGHEYYQLPSPRMQETYRFFVDAGADTVINHHQHCYSGYEIYKEKPILYGLGNFCFDSKHNNTEMWNKGFMVMLKLSSSQVSFELIPYTQCLYNPEIILLKDDGDKESFFSNISRLNKIINSETDLITYYEEFLLQLQRNINYLFEPYSNRILYRLYQRHLIPSLASKKKKLLILAYLQCESHYEKVIKCLKNGLGKTC